MKAWLTSLPLLAALACGVSTSGAALIASESFWTTGTEADPQYFDGVRFNTNGNGDVTVGNTGFSAGNQWQTGTGTIITEDDAPNGGGLTHSLATGTVQPGAVDYRVSHPRSASRLLATTAPNSGNYYLSGIVRANQNLSVNGDIFAMGMMHAHPGNSSNISRGIHIGMLRDGSGQLRLAAHGGGSSFDLGPASVDTNYMVVVGLTANAGGPDALDAWVAEDGGSLSQVLTGQALETFSGAADVSWFVLQQAVGNTQQINRAWADEMRFGTEFGDVVIPEPSTGALLGLVAGLGLLRRRRK